MLSVPVTRWLLSTCAVEGVEKRGKRSYRNEVETIHRADIYCNLRLFVLWRRMFNLGARILYTLLLSLGSILRHLKMMFWYVSCFQCCLSVCMLGHLMIRILSELYVCIYIVYLFTRCWIQIEIVFTSISPALGSCNNNNNSNGGSSGHSDGGSSSLLVSTAVVAVAAAVVVTISTARVI